MLYNISNLVHYCIRFLIVDIRNVRDCWSGQNFSKIIWIRFSFCIMNFDIISKLKIPKARSEIEPQTLTFEIVQIDYRAESYSGNWSYWMKVHVWAIIIASLVEVMLGKIGLKITIIYPQFDHWFSRYGSIPAIKERLLGLNANWVRTNIMLVVINDKRPSFGWDFADIARPIT